MQQKKTERTLKNILRKVEKRENAAFLIDINEQGAQLIGQLKDPVKLDTIMISLNDSDNSKLYGHALGDKVGDFESIRIILDLHKKCSPEVFMFLNGEAVKLTSLYHKNGAINILCKFGLFGTLFCIFEMENELIGKSLFNNNDETQALFLEYLFLNSIQKEDRGTIKKSLSNNLHFDL